MRYKLVERQGTTFAEIDHSRHMGRLAMKVLLGLTIVIAIWFILSAVGCTPDICY